MMVVNGSQPLTTTDPPPSHASCSNGLTPGHALGMNQKTEVTVDLLRALVEADKDALTRTDK